jgi:hypothetical protein
MINLKKSIFELQPYLNNNDDKVKFIFETVRKECEKLLGLPISLNNYKLMKSHDLQEIAEAIRNSILLYFPNCPKLFAVQVDKNDIAIVDIHGVSLHDIILQEFK